MEKENKTKIYALIAVLVAVLAVNQYMLMGASNSLKAAKITAEKIQHNPCPYVPAVAGSCVVFRSDAGMERYRNS